MATLTQVPPQQKLSEIPRKLTNQPVPIKVGIFGGQGSGKTTSAALLAAALSKEIYGGAPVFVTDTEPGWQFLKRRVFDMEGIEMIQRTEPTFKAMCANLREAEKYGACVWAIDSLTVVWQELMKSFRAKLGYIPIDKWGEIKSLWSEYTTLFLNSRMSCIALGRLGDVREEVEDLEHDGKTKLVKTGTQFKAGGGESFGYEPHLLLELSLERKKKTVKGQEREGEGRIVHRADVLKDRTWALNGKVLRWSDKPNYERGGYRTVWESLKKHFDEVQATMQLVRIQPGNSEDMIDSNGNGEFSRMRERKDAISAEIKAHMDLYFAGRGKDDIQLRIAISDSIFGVKSKEAADALSLEKLERGLRILQIFDKYPSKTDKNAPELITLAIQEYDSGNSELELPF